VLSRSAGTHLNVEQVLLSPLPHVGQPPITRSGSFLAKTHFVSFVLAPESAMIRAQSSG
jgi:hypothetical protein